MVVVGSHKK